MQHARRELFCAAKSIASGCANEGRFFWSGRTEFGTPMFHLIASKGSSNNTSLANNLLKNGFSKEHHSRQTLAPLQAKFDPKSIQESISERLNSRLREGIANKSRLKFSRNFKQRNPNNCHWALEAPCPTGRSPGNYDENLKRQRMSACFEASIWHLQQQPDPQIQPLKTALNQFPIQARLSCSAPCQQSSPS